MKFLNAIKLPGLILLASGLAIGCASTTDEAPKEEPVQSQPVEVAPEPEPQPVVEQSSESSYTVTRGDNLWDISAKPAVYNNPYQWPLIYKKNSDVIKDADLIYPGQELGIDDNPSSADVSNAVEHAKTRGSWSIGVTEDSDKAYLAR
jgi:LysM repeat protein